MTLRQLVSVMKKASLVYATWNPSDKSAQISLSGGNLSSSFIYGGIGMTGRATKSVSASKWYWEYAITAGGFGRIGIATSAASLSSTLGVTSTGWAYEQSNGKVYTNNSGVAYGVSAGAGDVIGVALDMDNGAIYFAKNGTWMNSGDPTSGAVKTGAAFTGLTGSLFPAIGCQAINAAETGTTKFGASAFAYAVPSGYNSGVY